ncbi:trypsin-like peptidase domain-containing protein [Pseudoalteromonas sp. SR45-6]|uniref:S1 family peptidase n=1 Tax=Pseudoalteromonas sp. SR45-6 TaxID=2760927 RepID=UPI001600349A|nr:serine protease [Pseudoalteromonas sp. SR45-6]MBB1340033.1 trypsin-like peptidase domain-containing protein [Pseudoalteromonas sp. SR45-6]
MASLSSRTLFEKYASAVVYVSVELPNGNQSIGTAFHVGEGVFVTARHVVEDNKILEIANTVGRGFLDPSDGSIGDIENNSYKELGPGKGKLVKGPLFHPDRSVDIAALVVEGLNCAVVPLGSHLDDWINDEAFCLAEVLVMGYPPIPFSKEPKLIATRAEVNTIIDKYTGGHPHFIVSSIARGGFSGGPCLIEWNFTLGVVTESLVEGDNSPEAGYMAVVSIEPVFVCLSHNGILPKKQAEGWNGLWDHDG